MMRHLTYIYHLLSISKLPIVDDIHYYPSSTMGVHSIVKLNTTCDKFKKIKKKIHKASPNGSKFIKFTLWVDIHVIFLHSKKGKKYDDLCFSLNMPFLTRMMQS